MAKPRNKAVVAGLTLTLTFGCLSVPALATTASGQAEDAAQRNLPAPSDFDRTDEFDNGSMSQVAIELAAVDTRAVAAISDEMKYFTRFESNCNYDQGFSYGDGYNAMGYYQFDRRYALVPFIESVYSYDPVKYSMFQAVVERGDELKTAPIYDSANKALTEIGRLANDAWHAAYAADPQEFAALQDGYSYNNYYKPVERLLASTYGVDISGRADCVKGLAWGMCNLYGSGGVQKFFTAAKLNEGMSDREMVTALCDAVIDYFSSGAGKNHAYAAGYVNRYKQEKRVCLGYVEQHEAEQQAPIVPPTPNEPETPQNPDANTDTDQGATDQAPDAGAGNGSNGSTDTEAPEGDGQDHGAIEGDSERPQNGPGNDVLPERPQDDSDSQGAPGDIENGPTDQGDTDAPGQNEGLGQGDDAGSSKPEVDPTPEVEMVPGAGAEQSGEDAPESAQQFAVVFDDCDPLTPNTEFVVARNAAFADAHQLPAAPVYEGYAFDGWYLYDRATRAYGEQFDPSAPVTTDIYVAAKWTKVELQIAVEPAPDASDVARAEALPQTFDMAGVAAIAATVLSAAGTAAVALGRDEGDADHS